MLENTVIYSVFMLWVVLGGRGGGGVTIYIYMIEIPLGSI